MVAEKLNINATPNQEAGEGSSVMTYPRCLSRLSASEVERTFSLFTGRDSRKPSGVYGLQSESMC